MFASVKPLWQRLLNATLASTLALGLAFSAMPTARPALAQTGTSYTVKAGDNLTRIARTFAVPLADLRAANNLRSDTIFPGQTLTIPDVTIVGRAIGAGSFNTLVTAVQAAGLVDALNGPGPLTVFAPTDAAFAKLPASTLNALLKDPATLGKILTYHVVPGKVMAADVVGLASAKSLQGEDITIKVEGGKVILNGNSTVTATDIGASNGVIHVIDTVILPPSLSTPAPAPAPAPEGGNVYTVKAGDSLGRIARANLVTVDDLRAANDLRSDTIFPGQKLVIPSVDIVGRAAGARTFTTLLAAAQAAGLVDALKGPGPLTVFAPTDAAFAKLGSRTINRLLTNPELLKKVLLYHVVSGKVMAADVVGLSSAASLQGASINISVNGGKVVLNGNSSVTATDISASNGVIHVIDTVILPPLDVVDTAILNGNFNTLITAVKAAGLEGALREAGPYTVFAPTDAAFAKLPPATLNALLKDPAALSNILLYHVVNGKVVASDVVGLSSATSLQGSNIAIRVSGGKVVLNGTSTVIATDVAASNGVIHVIDTVILPPQ
jgi:transforming growth factor-beta-induced protein